MASKSEYQKLRDNILRQARRYRKQGYKVQEPPKTARQSGISKATEKHIQFLTQELKDWQRQMQMDVASQKRARGESAVRFNDVVLENFKRNLSTKKYATGASKVSQWFDTVREQIGDDAMADLIQEAENSGVEVDRYVKYAKDEYAMQYIGDMTQMLYNKGIINDEQVQDILTNDAYISDEFSDFFSEFLGGL